MANIPFIDLKLSVKHLEPNLSKAINRVLERTDFINGLEVKEAEEKIAAYCNMPYAATVASGTEALHIALRALNVSEGDAVLMPGFTFPAAAEAAIILGAVPIFIDISLDTFNVDPTKVLEAIDFARSCGLKPKAFIAVDLYGLPVDFDALLEITNSHNIYFIDDAAQSFGATYKGKTLPGIADISTTSFYPAKPLGVFGEGGAIFCRDENFLEIVKSIRSHGCGAYAYDHVRLGINGRFDTIQAAILLEKLKIFDDELARRRKIAENYTTLLSNISQIILPKSIDGYVSSWAQYTIRLKDSDNRDKLKDYLQQKGIPTAIHYPKTLDEHPAFKVGYVSGKDGLKNSKILANSVLSLPFHPYLEKKQQEIIADAIKGYNFLANK